MSVKHQRTLNRSICQSKIFRLVYSLLPALVTKAMVSVAAYA